MVNGLLNKVSFQGCFCYKFSVNFLKIINAYFLFQNNKLQTLQHDKQQQHPRQRKTGYFLMTYRLVEKKRALKLPFVEKV